MTVTVEPAVLEGRIPAIASKSQAHRLMICAALSEKETQIFCREPSEDILATVRCLEALGARIQRKRDSFRVMPLPRGEADTARLNCGESGSTYRLLAPLACALGRSADFCLAGKLPERPMESLWAALETHGAWIEGKGTACPRVTGPISPGRYEISGGVSSQFISGLLFALSSFPGENELKIRGQTVSGGYIRMTLDALNLFGVQTEYVDGSYLVIGRESLITPGTVTVEGDWSNAAFWLCAGAIGRKDITLTGILPESLQGDRAICQLLRNFGAKVEVRKDCVTARPGELNGICVDIAGIPDLAPVLAVAAAGAKNETILKNAGRLRLKESNRLHTICQTLNLLGGEAFYTEDEIHICGKGGLRGGTVDSCGDHRIAMMAAVSSALCRESVCITNAQAVEKSYPAFFEDFAALGGRITKEER